MPEKVCVSGPTHVGVGESEVAGEQNDGYDVNHTAGAGSNAVPRVELDAVFDLDATVRHLDTVFERLGALVRKEEPVHV